MEQEPSMKIGFPDGEFDATRENTSLFTFMGKLALYNHVFFVKDEEEGIGSFLFSLHPSYKEISDYMVEHQYPSHINLQEVAECDMDAYEDMIHEYTAPDLEGGVPDEWLKSDS